MMVIAGFVAWIFVSLSAGIWRITHPYSGSRGKRHDR
jgi:hypothetical protein